MVPRAGVRTSFRQRILSPVIEVLPDFTKRYRSEPSHFELIVRQIASPASPSRTDVFSCGRSPLFHRAAVCNTRYLIGPPSGLSLRVMGRGMQTNSVRIASADNRTFAYPCPPRSTNSRCGARSGLDSDRARFRSKLFAYSRHERTPCLSSMLKVQSGFAPVLACRRETAIGAERPS